MNAVRHIIIVISAIIIFFFVPVYFTGYIDAKLTGADAVSSPTVVMDAPSGAYAVLINTGYHKDADKLHTWETFFNGGEIDYIFEDIDAYFMTGDAFGKELATSFASRLPENQMRIRGEDPILLTSKIYYGRFDIVILSEEACTSYGIDELTDTEKYLVIKNETV